MCCNATQFVDLWNAKLGEKLIHSPGWQLWVEKVSQHVAVGIANFNADFHEWMGLNVKLKSTIQAN